MIDTGENTQEDLVTLLEQQGRLIAGKRSAQMFPIGTMELTLPEGMHRAVNKRGVFHFNPHKITRQKLLSLSEQGRENEFLELGPYSKPEIMKRVQAGESLTTVCEYSASGVEIRTAIGTNKTVVEQEQYFKKTKADGSVVFCGGIPVRVQTELKKLGLM